MSKRDILTTAWLDCVGGLLATPEVQSMKQWRHHFSITCYEHSLFVSYVAFRLARRWGWDEKAAARAGLLHDLYLYDPADPTAHPGSQCLDHPVAALRNARALCPDLTEGEENAILTHMWPLAVHMPRCRVAVAVTLADKICSITETACLYKSSRIHRFFPAPVSA